MPIRKSSDDEESISDLSIADLQRLRKTKLLTQILLLLATLAFIANIYVLLRNSRAVNLQDGLYTELVPSSESEPKIKKQ
jgi:putative heme degradation protein